jgi:hypothetical protein
MRYITQTYERDLRNAFVDPSGRPGPLRRFSGGATLPDLSSPQQGRLRLAGLAG